MMYIILTGSPFVLRAPYMDISSVIVSGEGLVMAKVNQQVGITVIFTSRLVPIWESHAYVPFILSKIIRNNDMRTAFSILGV